MNNIKAQHIMVLWYYIILFDFKKFFLIKQIEKKVDCKIKN